MNKIKQLLSRLKQKPSKRTIIIASVITLVLAVVITGLVLRSQATAAATTYGVAIDKHFSKVFAEADTTKRIELVKNTATLQPVFMGELLSSKYKQANTVLKPKYEDIMKRGNQLTLDSNAYTSFAQDIIKDIIAALSSPTNSIPVGAEPSKEMEITLNNILTRANELQAVADKTEKIEFLKTYKTRGALISAIREMADTRKGVVQAYVDYTGALGNWATAEIKAVQSGSQTTGSFDESAYTKRANDYVDQYYDASDKAVDAMTSIVDELQASTYLTDLQARKVKVNTDTEAFRKELKTFNQI